MEFTCETATLADAVAKANRIAPNKGAAFDLAHGILFEVNPGPAQPYVYVKACDLETTYNHRVQILSGQGYGTWRLPSAVLAGFMNALPLGDGATVTFSYNEKQERVVVKAGKTKGAFRCFDPESFPKFGWFDESKLVAVPGFAKKCQQVAWAVDPKSAPLSGVHIDGESLVGCDRNRLAEVPIKVPVDHAITAPLTALAGVIKNTDEIKLAAIGNKLYLMTDNDTQATSILYMDPYPNVGGLRELMRKADRSAKINVEPFVEIVERMLTLCKTERYPLLSLRFERDLLRIKMDVPDMGRIDDEMDCVYPMDDNFTIHFTPGPLLTAMKVCAAAQSSWVFGPGSMNIVSITDGSGYRCLTMPRKEL